MSKNSLNPALTESHWTTRTTDDFVFRITFDFATQVNQELTKKQENQALLAAKLGVTKGRVSQCLNNPTSMGLKTIVRYARAIGKKVAVVLYDDGDQANNNGPINSEIFHQCWEQVGRPRDFFDLQTATTANKIRYIMVPPMRPHERRLPYGTDWFNAVSTFGNREVFPGISFTTPPSGFMIAP